MTGVREIYRCDICGHVVEVINEGAPVLVCCEQSMKKLEAKTADEGREKHVPVVAGTDTGVKVTVGSIAHPMEEEHYIKFVEILTRDKVLRAELTPGVPPEAVFNVAKADIVDVREFCTVHMLWKSSQL